MTRPDVPPELQRLLDAIDACEREAEAIVADMSEDEINWQDRPGQTWSVAQCLDHLTVTNDFYVRSFVPLVDAARTKGGGPFRGLSSSPGGRWFIRAQEPPVRQKMKAPARAVPRSRLARDGLVEAYKRSHDAYRALVAASADVDVNRVKGPNPFLKVIPMRVSTVLQIVPAHDRRHLWQAQNVKRALRNSWT
jgi:hypothetical protein